MIQENKDLLLKDLCARLPYGVKIMFSHNGFRWDYEQILDNITKCDDGEYAINGWGIHGIKPYLRSMSSMTEEECITLSKLIPYETDAWKHIKTPIPLYIANIEQFDFFHRHHLDWRGLIQKGLALEAPKNMYSNE